MKQATLCLLVKERNNDKKLLLAMKKRGFGSGKWNGVGGKVDPKKGDKNIKGAAIREAREEIGVDIKQLEKVALLRFYFPYIPNQEWDQDVHVFLVKDWTGKPIESEEMRPRWFKTEQIPYEQMWDDDKFWIPQVLEGKKLTAKFVFEEGERILDKDIELVRGFD